MYNDRDRMEAPADLGPEDLWGVILRGYVCQYLEEAGLFLGLARGGGGSRGDGLGGYDSRSDIFGREHPVSPGKTQTDKGEGVGQR